MDFLLTTPFFWVKHEKKQFFGGDQRWFKTDRLRNCGCGYIACTNLLCHKEKKDNNPIEYDRYMHYTERLRLYLPVIPRLGMNGIFMAVGMNLFFLLNHKPYFCFWGMSGKYLNTRIRKMLAENTPVVLCIGQNFPNYWGKKEVQLYYKKGDEYLPHSSTNKHFVTVTGMNDTWYQISSWGQELYINQKEYKEYIRRHSNTMASNILVVKKIRGGNT